MADANQRLKRAIELIIQAGHQLDVSALSFLKQLAQRDEFEGLVNKILSALEKMPDPPLFLTRGFFESCVITEEAGTGERAPSEDVGYTFKPYAKEVVAKIEVLDDSAERVEYGVGIDGYLDHFRSRFTKIERILRERSDVRDAVPISEALKLPLKSKMKTIGIVTEKRERRGTAIVRIEDYESSLTALVTASSNRRAFEKAKKLLVDQVVCVLSTKIRNDLFVANDFISPDIPERESNTSEEQVYAALISDVHVGSKDFLSGVFDRFINWLGGEGNSNQRELASRVKYLIVAGDLIDGIGVYPNQEDELVITDVYEQYAAASKLLEAVPEHIEIVVIPGNHDAVRQALPQPAIIKEYAKPLYDLANVVLLGNPARVRLHGVDFLIYHGTGLDDVVGAVPDVSYQNLKQDVTTAMKYFLRTRHLAPTYGSRTPIAPVSEDVLVISSPPDVLHMGHVHVNGYESYRGTLLINSGTWQGQTGYQEKMGLVPTPGIVPVVDLKNTRVMPLDFL
jgi:DNA polymerase II small subunit